MAYGRFQFTLHRKAGASSVGDHYEALYRSGRKKRPLPPQLPEFAIPIWNTFARLARSRSSNGFSLNPISYQEIDSYNRLMNGGLTAWEVDAILALDDAYLETVAENR